MTITLPARIRVVVYYVLGVAVAASNAAHAAGWIDAAAVIGVTSFAGTVGPWLAVGHVTASVKDGKVTVTEVADPTTDVSAIPGFTPSPTEAPGV